jgi:hypothetical protein
VSEIICFTSTKLQPGKKGIIKPDADGYYTLLVGGLNCFNSVGEYYVAEGAKDLFINQSSIFQRRVKNGNLKSEVGHPKFLPGMTQKEFIRRCLIIEETNICAHFRKVWLDLDYGKNHPEVKNPNMIGIFAEVKPAGEKGPYLKEALDNKSENVCFSIRSLTKDTMIRGVNHRMIINVLTFDWITEPGIATSNKWDTPGLESVMDRVFTEKQLESVVDEMSSRALGMESSVALAVETLGAVKALRKNQLTPSYYQW